ncbi:conserved hypothetical protein [Neospora caninum Liverpool]|uniref:Uncharacterized protein n=1 Tax=Neospora caninum (strain Liverpool) TaxID=572307 RepID=F0VKA8_NEOCL|nr:conserved hypothetical protein [Neospora caninum Liverpool]CBZ54509.1 conserved hypothetical protein [Neospora caninum Liverpool]CEL69222.1 TPA: hypothetical protein BN1204_049380 [Neospora caninum Liverpool]|eukprot:XP_003884539.1 conserved hypothetical protein [Neospora caninum Liverpool]
MLEEHGADTDEAANELRRGMEARTEVVAMARDIGAWTSADSESGDSAAAFVDAVLVPAGLVSDVARMMERAREAMNVDGLVSPDTVDFDEAHLKALLGLVMELESIVSSKIACVEMTKAFFKFVLVPLKLAAPVAKMLLDKKPKLLLAFAAKALLLKPTGGKGLADDNMKKLLLLALVAPKALDMLKKIPGGDLLPLLKFLPLLGGTKLETVLPIALLAMTALDAADAAGLLKAVLSEKLFPGTFAVEATSAGVSGNEMSTVDYLVESWAAGVEEQIGADADEAANELRRGMEARTEVVAMARDIGAWTSADSESGDSAAAFVDAVLVPAGLVSDVARMMERAREAMNVDGLVSPDTVDFDEAHLKALLGLVMELESIVSSKIACVEMTKAFFKFVLVPLKLAAPVSKMLLDKKPKLLLAFAAKALLLKPTGGKGLADDNMKKLLLLALVAPKALDMLKKIPGGDLLPLLKFLPLLGGTKLETVLPIALLAMTALDAADAAGLLKAVLSEKLFPGTFAVEATSAGVSGNEVSTVDYLVESWAAGVEEQIGADADEAANELRRGMEARTEVVAMARDIGAWTSADSESGDSAAAFVDAVLVPAGLVSDVARMMERAREAMNVDGLVSPDTVDFDEAHLKALLGLVMELESIVSSKIACVEMTKAFFKFVLVPLKLAAPVAKMLLDKKPKLLLAFAAKALLLKPTGGKGLADDNMKKLLLLALVAPKALDMLKKIPGGDLLPLLKFLPLLGGTKLETVLPIALLAMTALDAADAAGLLKAVLSEKLFPGTFAVEATSAGVSGNEMSTVDYLVESWAAGVEEQIGADADEAANELRHGMEARTEVVAMARDIGAWTSADSESGDSAAAFVDAVLVPAGLVSDVARMMERAREAMNVDGLVSPDTVDFDEAHLKALLGLVMELESIVSSKIACVEMTKAFFKFVLVPLKLAAPVAKMLLDKKPKLLLAFAAKALLLKPTGGKGLADDNMKKLLLLALVAPKVLDMLKKIPGGDLLPLLKFLPLLGGTKLETVLPIALLLLTGLESSGKAPVRGLRG